MNQLIKITLLLAAALPVFGSRYPDPVKLVKDGLNEYEKKGLRQAVAVWEIDTTDEIIGTMIRSEKEYGRVTDSEIICRIDIGAKTAVIYTVVNYKYGPLFLEFSLFCSAADWLISGIREVSWSVCHEKQTALHQTATLDGIAATQQKIASILEENELRENARNADLLKAIKTLEDEVRALTTKTTTDVRDK